MLVQHDQTCLMALPHCEIWQPGAVLYRREGEAQTAIWILAVYRIWTRNCLFWGSQIFVIQITTDLA